MKKHPIPLVFFAGTSKSGKTTSIGKLVPVLKQRGLRIAERDEGRAIGTL